MYDQQRANVIDRFFSVMRHAKGLTAGQPFVLEEWQRRFVTELLCTFRVDGSRQYRTAFLAVARKNGKSSLCAALGLFLLLADGQAKPEVICAAASRDQARLIFTAATEYVESSPILKKQCRVYRNEIRAKNGGILRTISAEARTSHGLNPSAILIDEFHAQAGREFFDVLATSLGARPNPLLVLITTAGVEQTTICKEIWDYALQVRNGAVEDDAFYPAIFASDPAADPFDEMNWYAANPNLGISLSMDYMRDAAKRAKQEPGALSAFLTLHLNIWTSQREKWLSLTDWDACFTSDYPMLEKGECFGGLDLASMHDLASFCLVFPCEGKFYTKTHFWIPEDRMIDRIRKDKVPYDKWAREGWVSTTPGNVIDFRTILTDIRELATKYKIREIAYDRFGATQIVNELTDAGMTVISFGQGFVSMASPTSELSRLIATREIRHDGNPCLRWNADNVVIEKDAAGNLKISKGKARQKVDGMVSLVMALDRALRHRKVVSVYENRDFVELDF